MIGLETSKKIGKSPKRAHVELKANEEGDSITDSEDDYEKEENESDNSEIEDNTSEHSHDFKSTSNAGWANVMQKILGTKKPKRKKTIVLAKAKKLCDVKEKEKDVSFEIDGVEEEIKTELEEASPTIESKHIQYNWIQAKPKRRETSLGIRVKPSILDRERERLLQKIATKGVVQLFNAVRQQQTDISKKLSQAGPLERKREQVLKNIDKNAFLDILMGGTKSTSVDNAVKSETTVKATENKEKDEKIWSVLRDDFVMGAKLKDWDKKNAEEEDSSAPEEVDSDD